MSKFRAVILAAVLSCCFSVGSTFFVTFLVMNTKVKKEVSPETYNGISLKMWVKTNVDHNCHFGRVAGKVVEFRYLGEAYPIAVLKGGKEVSVFWLVPMKTQRG